MVQITTLFSSAAAILLFGAMGTCQQQWGGPVNRAIVEQQLSDLKEAKVIPDGMFTSNNEKSSGILI